jgi:AcrR family transcriptional regulator
MNQLSDHPTRTLLLDAGLRLVQSISLSRLSVNQIVKEAGVAKGTFYVHFADRDSYLVALHGRFHEDINTVIAAATADIPSGRENLQRGIGAYLDSCLQRHALKALLVEARVAPGVAEAVRQRDQLYYTTVAQNFTAMGWSSAMYAARLFVTMVAEAALMELEQGEVVTAVRQILWQFIDSKQPSGNSS